MARQNKHIRFQVAHKAAQLITEEGISDYAFAKRKAAKFFGLMDGDTLPSNDEIKDAIKEYQAIFFDEKYETHLKILRLEALKLMKKLQIFNPYLMGALLDGSAGRYTIIQIQLYADSMKDIELFLINNKINYQAHDRKLSGKKYLNNIKNPPKLILEGLTSHVEIFIYNTEDLKVNKLKMSIEKLENILL